MNNLLNKYILQALDAYPYDLEEAIESLNYALSYDNKNPIALCLMGRVHSEFLNDYDTAIEYYKQALAENIHAYDVYLYYIDTLMVMEEYQEAQVIIDFALTIKGGFKNKLYWKQAILLEHQKKYKKALKYLKIALEKSYDNDFISIIKEEKGRIKNKLPKKKQKKKSKK